MRAAYPKNKKVVSDPLCGNCGKPHLSTMGETECRFRRPGKKFVLPDWPKSKHFTG